MYTSLSQVLRSGHRRPQMAASAGASGLRLRSTPGSRLERPTGTARRSRTIRAASGMRRPTAWLPPDQLLQVFRVAGPMDLDPGRRAIDFQQVVAGELNGGGAEILVKAIALRRSRNRHDPGLLRQQPGQRQLRRRRLFAFGERLQPADKGEVRLPVLLREPRDGAADVVWSERRLLVDGAGQKPSAERAEWHEANPQFRERRQNLALRLPPPERILALERRDRLNSVGASNGLNAGFRHSEVPDLAFADQILHRARHVLDRDSRIDAMLIEEIDAVGVEALQRSLGHVTDVRGATVQSGLLAVLEFERELRRNHDLVAYRSKCFANECFVRERSVGLGGVEERDSTFECRPNHRDAVVAVCRAAIAGAEAHAAEAECRHFEAALTQRPCLHAGDLPESSAAWICVRHSDPGRIERRRRMIMALMEKYGDLFKLANQVGLKNPD